MPVAIDGALTGQVRVVPWVLRSGGAVLAQVVHDHAVGAEAGGGPGSPLALLVAAAAGIEDERASPGPDDDAQLVLVLMAHADGAEAKAEVIVIASPARAHGGFSGTVEKRWGASRRSALDSVARHPF